LRDLSSFHIQVDNERSLTVWERIRSLAEAHRLTAYDAAYLELAQRTGLPLATLDRDLQKAAAPKRSRLWRRPYDASPRSRIRRSLPRLLLRKRSIIGFPVLRLYPRVCVHSISVVAHRFHRVDAEPGPCR
jgi:hypothetical protein